MAKFNSKNVLLVGLKGEGGSEKLYLQDITVDTYGSTSQIYVLTPKATALTYSDFNGIDKLCKNVKKVYMKEETLFSNECYLDGANFDDGMISFNKFTIYSFSDLTVNSIVEV